jgi:hypothetical protein
VAGLVVARVAKRPGRKRATNVNRYLCGKVMKQETLLMPRNTVGVVITGDERAGQRLMRLQSPLEVLNITKAQKLAGEELIRLKDLCRRYYFDTPRPFPKVSDPDRSQGHDGEVSAEVIDLGQKHMRRYTIAVDVLQKAGRGVIPVIMAVCFESRMPTANERPKLYKGLSELARLWGLNVKD